MRISTTKCDEKNAKNELISLDGEHLQNFVRAGAVETHDKISQEPLYTEIYSEHPDQAPAFTPTVRTPQCGHTVWGTFTFKVSIICSYLPKHLFHCFLLTHLHPLTK